MGVKTLITDGFDEGGEWLDADDRALLVHTLQGLVEKYVMRHEEAKGQVEPEDMTVLYVAGGPEVFTKIWIRDDTKRRRLEGQSMPEARWQREGDSHWFTWQAVLGLSAGYRLIPIYDRSRW